MLTTWKTVLALRPDRSISAGSVPALCDAIRRGADLRIYTEFIHNEHIDPTSTNPELVLEVSEFAATYLIEGQWVAGIMTLRQPISLPDGFGPRPSMSFFMYNQDGQQAIARPFLDGGPVTAQPGPAPLDDWSAYPKYHQYDNWDAGTNAPSHNFVYDFEAYRFNVRDDWQEVLSHRADGSVISGSIDDLADAFTQGAELKIGIRGLCADLSEAETAVPDHEVFIQAGPGYYYTKQKLFIAGSHPLVRVRPAIPMRYVSRGWDFGWLMPRTDGHLAQLLYDPYTLKPFRRQGRFAMRWFVR
jgi:hypothetical protein